MAPSKSSAARLTPSTPSNTNNNVDASLAFLSTPSLPVEILSHIIGYVALDSSALSRQQTRIACSLTCRSFYHQTRSLSAEIVVDGTRKGARLVSRRWTKNVKRRHSSTFLLVVSPSLRSS